MLVAKHSRRIFVYQRTLHAFVGFAPVMKQASSEQVAMERRPVSFRIEPEEPQPALSQPRRFLQRPEERLGSLDYVERMLHESIAIGSRRHDLGRRIEALELRFITSDAQRCLEVTRLVGASIEHPPLQQVAAQLGLQSAATHLGKVLVRLVRLSSSELAQAAEVCGAAESLPHTLSLQFGAPQVRSWGGVTIPAPKPGGAERKPVGSAPAWFLALDQNRDACVSPREFLGSPAAFQRLDGNSDGLSQAEEASR